MANLLQSHKARLDRRIFDHSLINWVYLLIYLDYHRALLHKHVLTRLIHKTLMKGNRKDQKGKTEGFQEIQRLRKQQVIEE